MAYGLGNSVAALSSGDGISSIAEIRRVASNLCPRAT